MRNHRLLGVVGSVVLLFGCATGGQKENAGMVVGGVLGGAVGSQLGQGPGKTAAIIAGTLGGAAIGGAVGRSMDDTDRMKTGQTLETVRTGVPASWRNPDTGVTYQVTPTRTYDTANGPCRDYTMDANMEGRTQVVHGTACRQSDGTWKNVG